MKKGLGGCNAQARPWVETRTGLYAFGFAPCSLQYLTHAAVPWLPAPAVRFAFSLLSLLVASRISSVVSEPGRRRGRVRERA